MAPGLIERPYVFAGNDTPGVMLSGAVRRLINLWAVKPGSRAVVLSANPEGDAAIADLEAAGARSWRRSMPGWARTSSRSREGVGCAGPSSATAAPWPPTWWSSAPVGPPPRRCSTWPETRPVYDPHSCPLLPEPASGQCAGNRRHHRKRLDSGTGRPRKCHGHAGCEPCTPEPPRTPLVDRPSPKPGGPYARIPPGHPRAPGPYAAP